MMCQGFLGAFPFTVTEVEACAFRNRKTPHGLPRLLRRGPPRGSIVIRCPVKGEKTRSRLTAPTIFPPFQATPATGGPQ